MTDLPQLDWADILAFHWDAGVDLAVGEAPVDRFAESAAEAVARGSRAPRQEDEPAAPQRQGLAQHPSQHPSQEPARARQAPAKAATGSASGHPLVSHTPDEAAMAARDAARGAASLDELRALLEQFEGCALKRTASRLVFADGNPQARVMLVGEAPGRDEDQQGVPFVGRAGRLLDLMLGAIGLDRSSAYIANIIPWRPPGNRTPTPQETAICLPFITRQIELANPDILVCLGGQSAQALLATTEGITKLRGRFMPYETGTRTIRAIATFHPAYLLRTPIGKRLAWRDLLAIEAALAGG
ncbi:MULTISPECIES: uracil-DNA glycosylase [unclassified Xanthobacter]|uniref:uracil-DNA glycosylase n=1 Tax=unclassified Xanthobacter TaxID=2623496 RepID=UPI001EDFACFE|nr:MULTISPECIES: uracil-DNA glycosylase [unclassified Xanthobacter]